MASRAAKLSMSDLGVFVPGIGVTSCGPARWRASSVSPNQLTLTTSVHNEEYNNLYLMAYPLKII